MNQSLLRDNHKSEMEYPGYPFYTEWFLNETLNWIEEL